MIKSGASDLISSGLEFKQHILSLRDLSTFWTEDFKEKGKKDGKNLENLSLVHNDQTFRTTRRFWNSLARRAGVGTSVFNLMDYDEFFERLASRRLIGKRDRIRVVEDVRANRLLGAMSVDQRPLDFETYMEVVDKKGGSDVTYNGKGVISSLHSLSGNPAMQIVDESFIPGIVVEAPIDGYGPPRIYLSIVRTVCVNGMVFRGSAFKTEIKVGDQAIEYQIERAIDSYSNDEGFDAIAERIKTARTTWLSVNEAYQIMTRFMNDAQRNSELSTQMIRAFNKLVGNLNEKYGIVNLNQMSPKHRAVLSTEATVFDAVNFCSEQTSHRLNKSSNAHYISTIEGVIGDMLTNPDGFDLEGVDDGVLAGKTYPAFYDNYLTEVIQESSTPDILKG